ncbi:MAG TPA: hypothetical protein VM490_14020 [Armatimonadaceae bacterium]|nr:hypothetical protein [Armatimonadaceae bacterium]
MNKDMESKDQKIIETLKNLERLESLVEDSPHLFGFFFRFNDEEFYMLVNKIRASLPEELRRAGKIAQNSDKIMEAAQTEAEQSVVSARSEAATLLEEARAEAGRIVEEARATAGNQVQQAEAKAAAMVEESEIVRIARAQSGDIVRRAEREADDIRAGADEYAREVLLALENNVAEAMTQVEGRIGSVLGTIQRGRQALERRKPDTAAGAAERRENMAVSSANGTGKSTASPGPVPVGNARG